MSQLAYAAFAEVVVSAPSVPDQAAADSYASFPAIVIRIGDGQLADHHSRDTTLDKQGEHPVPQDKKDSAPSEKKNMKQIVGAVDVPGKKTFWTRIGVAFETSDGSWNLRFDYIPTRPEITIQLRDFGSKTDAESKVAASTA